MYRNNHSELDYYLYHGKWKWLGHMINPIKISYDAVDSNSLVVFAYLLVVNGLLSSLPNWFRLGWLVLPSTYCFIIIKKTTKLFAWFWQIKEITLHHLLQPPSLKRARSMPSTMPIKLLKELSCFLAWEMTPNVTVQ